LEVQNIKIGDCDKSEKRNFRKLVRGICRKDITEAEYAAFMPDDRGRVPDWVATGRNAGLQLNLKTVKNMRELVKSSQELAAEAAAANAAAVKAAVEQAEAEAAAAAAAEAEKAELERIAKEKAEAAAEAEAKAAAKAAAKAVTPAEAATLVVRKSSSYPYLPCTKSTKDCNCVHVGDAVMDFGSVCMPPCSGVGSRCPSIAKAFPDAVPYCDACPSGGNAAPSGCILTCTFKSVIPPFAQAECPDGLTCKPYQVFAAQQTECNNNKNWALKYDKKSPMKCAKTNTCGVCTSEPKPMFIP
jgi:hypothetical protein